MTVRSRLGHRSQNDPTKLGGIKRLLDDHVRQALHAVAQLLTEQSTRGENEAPREGLILRTDLTVNVEAADARHHHVAENHIVVGAAQLLERALPIECDLHAELLVEHTAHGSGHQHLVVHDQQPQAPARPERELGVGASVLRRALGAIDKKTLKRLPRPSSLVT